jgi:hypothetical protein
MGVLLVQNGGFRMDPVAADVLFRFVFGTPLLSTKYFRQSSKTGILYHRRSIHWAAGIRRNRVARGAGRTTAVFRTKRSFAASLENSRLGFGGILCVGIDMAFAVCGLAKTACAARGGRTDGAHELSSAGNFNRSFLYPFRAFRQSDAGIGLNARTCGLDFTGSVQHLVVDALPVRSCRMALADVDLRADSADAGNRGAGKPGDRLIRMGTNLNSANTLSEKLFGITDS